MSISLQAMRAAICWSTARDQVGSLLCKCLTADAAGNVDKMIENAFEDAVDECEYNT